ncbi:Transcriptional regulator LytR [bioreactor metagenome]|jgi:LCP family protein required for cell wall assembly|uniref:Transcriptional regulator LytR n=1 Tax=bioreactor metagenome TaxID=1076179 RepID=A0A644VVD2_9ZZZZ|nr:LCP family protein [Aminivibrio sp.]MDD3514138.1 LCP family protein [Synergistaceae bacterium]MEA4951091.1 LCP family protein [Aminivibrio sp.]NCB16507.1 LytR family transcriptional regulator [Synergistales bacterium]HPF84369.1 LCP family protein [Aminivibrio sp.]
MKIMKIAAILLLAVSSAFAGAAMRVRTFVDPKPQTIKESISFTEASGTANILLIGIDDVDGGRRADAIAFATVDIDNKIVRVMSVPRDTRVQIPGKGWDKINHAYAYGGVEKLRETVVNFLGLPVNYYVLVNYDTFPSIIDLIGGVEVDVERRMVYNDYAGKLFINIPKGFQKLDGKNALHYVRFRHDAMGDIGRVKRQQEFIKAVLKKVQTPSMIPKIPELAQKAIEMVNSDMTPAQALQLASYLADLSGENLHFFTLPGKAAYISNLSYWIGDTTEASALLTGLPEKKADGPVSGDRSPEGQDSPAQNSDIDLESLIASVTTPVSVLNGAGKSGLGKDTATALQKIGIDVAHIGNAKHFDYRTTSIQVPEKGAEAVRNTAQALGEIAGVGKNLISKSSAVPHVTIIIGKDSEKVLERLGGLARR